MDRCFVALFMWKLEFYVRKLSPNFLYSDESKFTVHFRRTSKIVARQNSRSQLVQKCEATVFMLTSTFRRITSQKCAKMIFLFFLLLL